MKVINLFGGPGAGKSTTAAGLFHLMKMHHLNVELIQEVAKHLVWAERYKSLDDQLYVFAKQNDRLHTLKGNVGFAISDSPLILSALYMPRDYPPSFSQFVLDLFGRYENVNVVLKRVHPYQQVGRIHSEEESNAISRLTMEFLSSHDIPFVEMEGDREAPARILRLVQSGPAGNPVEV